MNRLRLLVLVILSVFHFSVLAFDRQLHWESLSVKARLEESGRLRVEETQTMVFTGDWNGGERTFNIRPRQSLEVIGMARIDEKTGAAVEMERGSLDEIDHWDLVEDHKVRWRARRTSDAEFFNTKITYVLRYSLSNVLLVDDDRFTLDHDFAFPKRDGVIERFRLDLSLDPAWQTQGALQSTWTAGPIPPGKSFVLRIPLRFSGSRMPEADKGLSDTAKMMLGSLVLVSLAFLIFVLIREWMLGRLDPPESEITRAWLKKNVLQERAEVIGAMWDEDVGAAEVSATLARMVAEGRLESRVNGEEMDLTILSREGLSDYEQALIDGLFVSGDHTSTSIVRSHYEESGFNPATKISEGLKNLVKERLPKGEPVKPSGLVPTLLFFGVIGALIYAVMKNEGYFGKAVGIFFGGLFASFFAIIGPSMWRARKLLGVTSGLMSMIPAALITGVTGVVVWRSSALGRPNMPQEIQLAFTLYALWIFIIAAHTLRSNESRESIAFRKMLGSAREYFRRELKKERPALDDDWYPYILAFGLSDDVKSWFKSFPGAASGRDHYSPASSSSSGSSFGSSSPSWTGGGGTFGGAGATGAWAIAASGMAAGVAAPSDSSSSSSSGGSSGGGGGGGW